MVDLARDNFYHKAKVQNNITNNAWARRHRFVEDERDFALRD